MADRVTARTDDSKQFAPHPTGGHVLKCVDVVDYGMVVDEWEGRVKVQHKVALVFQSKHVNENGHPYLITTEFTVSMFELANLRKFLEMWRGQSYTEEQAKAGVPLDKLEGRYGYATIEHGTSKKGRKFANIVSIMPVPEGVPLPEVAPYARPDFLTKRKAEYAAEYQRHKATEEGLEGTGPGKPGSAVTGAPNRDTSFDDFPSQLEDEDDDLPF